MEEYLQRNVVIDVESLFVYVGELQTVSEKNVSLVNADVHDLRDSNTTRERYVLDTKLHGIRPNRRRVLIGRTQIISISLLDDVLD